MPRPTPPHSGPGRPPDLELEPRAHRAALQIYEQVGWAGFTLDRVAREAGIGKAALYRRWPTKQDLLVASVASLRRTRPRPADDQGLAEALHEVGSTIARRYFGEHGLAYLRIQLEAKIYPDELGAALEALRRSAVAAGRAIIVRAIERGELPSTTSPALLMDAVAGAIAHRLLMLPPAQLARRTATAAPVEPLVDQVVALVLAGAGHRPTSHHTDR